MPRQPVIARFQWGDLPPAGRQALSARLGVVLDAESAPAGLTPGIASRLDTRSGYWFVKAIPLRSPALLHYLREIAVNSVLPAEVRAPTLRWSTELAGWLVLVFDHVDGRRVDLSPGSADISAVINSVAALGAALTPCRWQDAPTVTQRLAAMGDRLDLAGNTLLHTDLHEGNLLVDPNGQLHIVDWSLACVGPGWVEAAWFAARLIAADHSPAEADRILARIPAWQSAPVDLAARLASSHARWTARMAASQAARRPMADATAQWAGRLTSKPHRLHQPLKQR